MGGGRWRGVFRNGIERGLEDRERETEIDDRFVPFKEPDDRKRGERRHVVILIWGWLSRRTCRPSAMSLRVMGCLQSLT